MKNLRQLLRRPVRECHSTVSARYDADGVYVITTVCPHLKTPRVRQHRLLGDAAFREHAERDAWELAQDEVRTHVRYSDPW